MTLIGKSMLLFFMTLVYLYFHRTTVQGSSVGVSCRLFLLRLYFAQTHSSLAIAPRPNFGPKSTKLEKTEGVLFVTSEESFVQWPAKSWNLWGFFLTPWFFVSVWKWPRIMGIIQGLLNFRWYRSWSFLEFANGVVLKRATLQMQRRSNWLNLPLDTSVGADLSSVQS